MPSKPAMEECVKWHVKYAKKWRCGDIPASGTGRDREKKAGQD
jgi:hypothetical protein